MSDSIPSPNSKPWDNPKKIWSISVISIGLNIFVILLLLIFVIHLHHRNRHGWHHFQTPYPPYGCMGESQPYDHSPYSQPQCPYYSRPGFPPEHGMEWYHHPEWGHPEGFAGAPAPYDRQFGPSDQFAIDQLLGNPEISDQTKASIRSLLDQEHAAIDKTIEDSQKSTEQIRNDTQQKIKTLLTPSLQKLISPPSPSGTPN